VLSRSTREAGPGPHRGRRPPADRGGRRPGRLAARALRALAGPAGVLPEVGQGSGRPCTRPDKAHGSRANRACRGSYGPRPGGGDAAAQLHVPAEHLADVGAGAATVRHADVADRAAVAGDGSATDGWSQPSAPDGPVAGVAVAPRTPCPRGPCPVGCAAWAPARPVGTFGRLLGKWGRGPVRHLRPDPAAGDAQTGQHGDTGDVDRGGA